MTPTRRTMIKSLGGGMVAAAAMTAGTTPASAGTPDSISAATWEPGAVSKDEMLTSLYGFYGWLHGGRDGYPDGVLPPKVKILGKVTRPDHHRVRLRYRVDVDHTGAEEYAYAYLLTPNPPPADGRTRLPLVIAAHPTNPVGKDSVIGKYPTPPADEDEAAKRAMRAYALELVREGGFVVFAPDRAGFGERRLLDDSHNDAQQMAAYEEYLRKFRAGWHLTHGKNVWDLQRALDYLVGLDYVDPDRIGVIGHSLGAWDSIMLIGTDERVKTAVPNSGGMIEFVPELWSDAEAFRHYLKTPSEQTLKKHVTPMMMLSAGRSLLYLWDPSEPADRGRGNLVEGFRTIQTAYKTSFRTLDKTDLALHLHSSGHFFTEPGRAAVYRWLEQKLGDGATGGGGLADVIDDTDPTLSYTGTWAPFNSSRSLGGSHTTARDAGASVTVPFTGGRAQLIGVRASDYGFADIYLDGEFQETIDSYSSAPSWQNVLFDTGPIPSGEHTLRMVARWEKRPAAGNYYINFDAALYVS